MEENHCQLSTQDTANDKEEKVKASFISQIIKFFYPHHN